MDKELWQFGRERMEASGNDGLPVVTCVGGMGFPRVADLQPGPIPGKPLPATYMGFANRCQSLTAIEKIVLDHKDLI